MNLELTQDQQILIDSVRDFCQAEMAPHSRRWDEEERCPDEIVPKLAELSLLGMLAEEEYGGAGVGLVEFASVLEELGRWDGSICLTVASHNSLATGHIRIAGTPEQKRRWVPQLATGKTLGAWGLTEPGSGSDAAAARTAAVRTPDGGRLTAPKTS